VVGSAEQSFNTIVGELDYPMLVVTAAAGEKVGGCLVGFASQASISPPRFAVFLSEKNRTCRIAREAELLGVHFLSDEDGDLAELFGSETGDEVDKLARVSWQPGAGATPLLHRCPNRFVGLILDRFPVGDHVAFLLEPTEADHAEPVRQFPFRRARQMEPGHSA
jgi:flavin reductase (DIM6/NTAB) family NADH-FMN oxidoreductase RutF